MARRDDPTPPLNQLLEEIRSSKEAILASERRLQEATDLLYQWLEAGTPAGPSTPVFADPPGRAIVPAELTEAPVDLPLELPALSESFPADLPAAPASSSQQDYLHVISHDLKEPMRGIIYFTQLLAEDYGHKLDEEGQGHLEYILAATRRMNRLLEDVLALSRLQRRPASLTRTDLNALVHGIINELKGPLREKRGAVEVRATLPVLVVDTGRLHDVFWQLLKNAVMYSESPARIEVGGEAREDGTWLFYVRDQGMGIEPQFLEQIFGLFQRLHTWEAYEGTGAGLTLAKMIVEQHGGRLWAVSSPGKGSTFYFTLPAREEEPLEG